MRTLASRRLSWAILILLLGASCGGGPAAATLSASPVAGGLSHGLIAYAIDSGVGVLDPTTGKTVLVAPLPPGGAFRLSGPVWGPAPGLSYPVVYFTVHDDRPAESRNSPGVVPYDWLFRVDPFTGHIDPIAASADPQSEGPLGLVANSHYLAMSVGCCTTYEVDALDLTQSTGAMKVLSRPPSQAAFFTEGAAPGTSGLIAVRAFGTGLWYWLNADAGVLNPFPLSLGPSDGPIAISADGTMAAVSLPVNGAVIEPINSSLPLPSASPVAGTAAAATASPAAASPRPPVKPRRINSALPHVDSLAWSPDATQLALAVGGEVEIYSSQGKDGTPPVRRYLGTNHVQNVDWSAPIPGESFAAVKASAGPQAVVDALLGTTRLPAAADTPANRPLTKVYLWQWDSSKASPISAITDATPAILQQYPPLAAGVFFHHWAPFASWELLGGCFRYRVVITGSVAPVASTIGLAANTPCSSK
jgi:hypothetical protein